MNSLERYSVSFQSKQQVCLFLHVIKIMSTSCAKFRQAYYTLQNTQIPQVGYPSHVMRHTVHAGLFILPNRIGSWGNDANVATTIVASNEKVYFSDPGVSYLLPASLNCDRLTS